MYFLAILTTKRRFASVSFLRAATSPLVMRLANSTSSGPLSKDTLPISRKYI